MRNSFLQRLEALSHTGQAVASCSHLLAGHVAFVVVRATGQHDRVSAMYLPFRPFLDAHGHRSSLRDVAVPLKRSSSNCSPVRMFCAARSTPTATRGKLPKAGDAETLRRSSHALHDALRGFGSCMAGDTTQHMSRLNL